MIEVTILNYLNSDNRLSAPAFTEIPKDKPSKFFILEKTGSTLENHIYSSTFTIQSYADTMYNAALMNEEVIDVMLNGLIMEGNIAKVDLNTDYNFTDTTTKQYRYQAVFDIVHY